MQESKKKSEKKQRSSAARKFLKFYLIYRVVSFFLVVAACLGVYFWAASEIDPAADEKLFRSLGRSTTTLVYEVTDPESFARSGPTEGQNIALHAAVHGTENSRWLKSEEMPDTLAHAFVAIEDHRFYRHHGVDWLRTAKAGVNTLFRFEKRFGGSTITQQVVKNVSGESEIAFKRKVKEMIRAIRLEKKYTKDEILTMYLNIVPLGHGCTGVEAAAQYYYGKSAEELTVAECAGLAAITNSPAVYDPVSHPEANRERRELILQQMRKYGYITEEICKQAIEQGITLTDQASSGTHTIQDWYTETMLEEIRQDLMNRYDLSKSAAGHMIYGGGLRIYAALDGRMQETVERKFAAAFTEGDGQCAFVVIDPQSGRLLAVAGGAGKKQGNRLLNGATALRRPPGSVLKPIALYAPAVEARKVCWSTVFDDVPKQDEKGNYWPNNSNHVYDGNIPLCEALAYSKNTVAAELYRMLGDDAVFRSLALAGIDDLLLEPVKRGGVVVSDRGAAPLALGQLTEGVTLLEMTAAYTPLAGDGEWHSPFSYYAVCDEEGKCLLAPTHRNSRYCSGETAALMTRMLMGVTDHGTASSVSLRGTVEVAGKTGTSGGAADRWFVGYTPTVLAGIRVTSSDGKSAAPVTHKEMLAVWDAIMRELSSERGGDPAARHFDDAENLIYAPFCRDSGCAPDALCHFDLRGDRVSYGYYLPGTEPTEYCDTHVEAWRDSESGEVSENYFPGSELVALLGGRPDDEKKKFDTLDLPYYLCNYAQTLPAEPGQPPVHDGGVTDENALPPAEDGTKEKEKDERGFFGFLSRFFG